VLGRKRIALLPDIPSVSETVPDYEAGTSAGIGVPKGTPRDIIERLNREINAQDRATLSRLEDAGAIPLIMSPEQYGAFVEAETIKWTDVVRRANVKPE
jgi:tripartite-type tricarboxylate transporter receptor subunit TctC